MQTRVRKLQIYAAWVVLFAGILACGITPTQVAPAVTPEMTPTPTSLPTLAPVPLFQIVTMQSQTQSETGQSPAFTVAAQIPSLQGSDDPRVKQFNDEMTLLTQEEIAKFKDNVVQVQPVAGETGSFFDQQFERFPPDGNLVSLRFQIMTYIQGAAHPGTHVRTVTYDLEAGRDVRLADLFLPDSDYLGRIANYCIQQLQVRDIDFEAFASGAAPLAENYGNWNITPAGLLITFEEYQVAPYAAGAQEVVVPYSELQPLIDPHGPLAGYVP